MFNEISSVVGHCNIQTNVLTHRTKLMYIMSISSNQTDDLDVLVQCMHVRYEANNNKKKNYNAMYVVN